ncbi:MAG: polyphenol oxidase family protein [Myxococcota bacterium]
MSAESALPELCDRVLIGLGVPHGFGQKGSQVPENAQFMTQVHGIAVHSILPSSGDGAAAELVQADAVYTRERGCFVGVVTADCVPILVSDLAGEQVVAIHAGWRGLAAGVIEAGVAALSGPVEELAAAVGPSARGCCYEVDAPVRNGLERRYATHLGEVFQPGRAGHYQLDLPLLATHVLEGLGIPSPQIGVENRLCTVCNPDRFESYRRDGADAGRLRHFIGPKGSE